jgi:peptidyl-prolyl cis-trans isomerase C
MTKWLNEPLLHFLCIGASVFIFFSIVTPEEVVMDSNKIVITVSDIERISANWYKRLKRLPTETELQGLVESYIKEEVYYREALSLGLDKNDMILRRRLMQKMEFLSNDLSNFNTPDETQLKNFLLDNLEKYKLPVLVSFTHIYFNPNKRGANILEDAKGVLSGLKAAGDSKSGDSFMLQYDFIRKTESEIAQLFGKGFAKAIFKSKPNTWQGPIQSGYGAHLVRVSQRQDSRIPKLASVINKVRSDWMFEQRQKMNKEIYKQFKARYEISVEKMPDPPSVIKQIAYQSEIL